MEPFCLGNMQDKLGTGNKEPDKVQPHIIEKDHKAWQQAGKHSTLCLCKVKEKASRNSVSSATGYCAGTLV